MRQARDFAMIASGLCGEVGSRRVESQQGEERGSCGTAGRDEEEMRYPL